MPNPIILCRYSLHDRFQIPIKHLPMKKLLTALLTLLTVLTLQAQHFEGKIVYQNSYKTKYPAISDEQWGVMLGTRQEYFIRKGDYRSTTNGTMVGGQLYIHKENRLYNLMKGQESVLYQWSDASVNTDEVLEYQLNKNATQILGYSCDELILVTRNGTQKFYFNAKLGVDTQLFVQHLFGNWAYYLSKAGAVPLKQIMETPQIVMESVAIEVSPQPLDPKSFQLPADAKTARSPY
jgi:hypothetical protein